MKRLAGCLALVAGLWGCEARTPVTLAFTGNGAPSGAHFNLNLIGVSHDKNPGAMGGGGSVIFVGLGGKNETVNTKIMLSEGEFAVLDKDGTDGTASFQLPAPGSYTVWARALGKPGGKSTMTTCATDPTTGEVICSTENVVSIRDKGQSKFSNVTKQLTTIELVAGSDVALACGTTTVSLFDPCLEGFFWNYDNQGLKLLQIRFYPN